ncbi:MAG: phosphatidate cytidylyltransferase [Deltaproteobacteria bacterium]
MLAWRLFLAPILIIVLIGLFAADAWCGEAAPILWVLACLLSLRSTWELVQLLRVRFEPRFSLVASSALAVVSASWIIPLAGPAAPIGAFAGRLGPAMLVYALAVMALFVSGMARYRAPGKTIETLGAELVALTYVAVFVSLTVQLRWVGPAPAGYLPLASLIVATKCGDTCAYFAGHAFGKTKLSPLISPGKTRAGAVGAFLGAAAGSWAWLFWGTKFFTNAQPGPWYWAVLYGLVLGVVGLVGDLAESLLKRDVGVKDSAPLLPGFGGLLDLLDSVIFTGPVAYLLWEVLPLTK